MESARAAETAVGRKNVTVRISQKITECLGGDHRAWHGIVPRSRPFQIHLESLTGATAQLRKQVSVIKEIPTEDLGDTEDKVPIEQEFTLIFCMSSAINTKKNLNDISQIERLHG